MTAFNLWYVMDGIDITVRRVPSEEARRDNRPAVGPVSFKKLGLAMVAADLLLIAAVLYRRPSRQLLPLAAAMGVFAFFMLATQMHGRYVIPAVALLAICWETIPASRWIWIALTITATLNPGITLLRDNVRFSRGSLPSWLDHLTLAAAAVIAVANVLIFLGAHGVYLRSASRLAPAELAANVA